MKNERIPGAIIIFLVVVSAVLGILFYYQNQKLVKISENSQSLLVPSSSIPTSLTSPSASNISSSRFQFGPLISPDGQWFLSEEHLETPENVADVTTHLPTISGYVLNHVLSLSNLYGQNKKVIVPQILEYRDRNADTIPGYPAHKSWVPAGWSPDGQTVYFVTSYSPGGDPAQVNNEQLINGGKNLEAVRITDGEHQTILKADDILKDGYLMDVYAQKNIALVTGKKIFLVNFDGTVKKKLYTLSSTEQDAVAVFDSTGSRVAIAIGGDVGTAGQQDIVHCGQALKVIDIANFSTKVISTPNSCWSLVGWTDSDTLRIQTQDKETDIKIK